MAARINQQMPEYRDFVEGLLEAEGHTIITPDVANELEDIDFNLIDENTAELTKEQAKESREEAWTERAYRVAYQLDINEQKALELEEKRNLTLDEQFQLRKYRLQKRYAIENYPKSDLACPFNESDFFAVTPELVKKDDDGWYGLIKLHYYLNIGRQYLPSREKKMLDTITEQGNGKVFLPDINKRSIASNVGILEALNIPSLLENPDREFRASDEDLIAIAEKAISFAPLIKDGLGIKIHQPKTKKDGSKSMPVIPIIKQLLETMGVSLERGKRDSSGDRLYCYYLTGLDDGREQVETRWLERDQAMEERLYAEQSESVTARIDHIHIPPVTDSPVTDSPVTDSPVTNTTGTQPQSVTAGIDHIYISPVTAPVTDAAVASTVTDSAVTDSSVTSSQPQSVTAGISNKYISAVTSTVTDTSPPPKQPPPAPKIKVGLRVRLHFPGSMRSGEIGVVKSISDDNFATIRFHNRSLRRDLRELEISLNFRSCDGIIRSWLELLPPENNNAIAS